LAFINLFCEKKHANYKKYQIMLEKIENDDRKNFYVIKISNYARKK
jgi:hypothetical protein